MMFNKRIRAILFNNINYSRNISRIVLLITFAIVLLAFYVKEDPGSYSLTVEVHKTRNVKGVIQFALYNKDGTIPDKQYTKYYKKLTAKIVAGYSTVTFNDLPKGKYVVNILHDENENGEIDKGLLLPIEGVGFSNYESIGPTNRPKFSKASFELVSDMTIEVKITYM